jgi:hypothetical protein
MHKFPLINIWCCRLHIPRKLLFIGNSSGWYHPLDFVFRTEDGVHNQIQNILFPRIQQWQSNGILYMPAQPNSVAPWRYNARKEKTESMLHFVSNTTKRKIRQLTALDYCCLNFQLPTASGVPRCRSLPVDHDSHAWVLTRNGRDIVNRSCFAVSSKSVKATTVSILL